jgi:cell wall-associated NlpC family hydrolase
MPILALRLLLGADLGRAALRLLLLIAAGGLLLAALATQAVVSAALMALVGVVPVPGGPGDGLSPPPAVQAALAAHFAEAERLTDVPASLLMAVARVESNFNPRAVGPLIERFAATEDARALGMMQFLPSTYRALAPRVDALTGVRLGMDGLWQPRHAIVAAALYLKDHGAPGDVRHALYRYNNDWEYVDRVTALAARYAAAAPADGVAARALALARTQLGVPYRWGGGAPGRGFDCSGLTQWAFAEAGHRLPRTAQQQFVATQRVSRAELRPGDLVFFAGDPAQPDQWVTHVGVYAGGGRMVDAPAPGAVVREEPVWWSSFVGGGRVVAPAPRLPRPPPA